nr:NACHT, LRR and PYD domains-containing protein 1-like [Pelodiscus sinensis]|eukprot:XP_025039429.1 NACHT, LRR and PYD domains-containing protein 1-like [Pelodiscus sinensis]
MLAVMRQDELRRWKEKLSQVALKEGYQPIPPALLEGAGPWALVELLISYYGEDYAMHVASLAKLSCIAEEMAAEAEPEPALNLMDISSAHEWGKEKPSSLLPRPPQWLRKLRGKPGKHQPTEGTVGRGTPSPPGPGVGTEATGPGGEPDALAGPSGGTSRPQDPWERWSVQPFMKVSFPTLALPSPPQWLKKLMGKKDKQLQKRPACPPPPPYYNNRPPSDEEGVYTSLGPVTLTTKGTKKPKPRLPTLPPDALQGLGGGPGPTRLRRDLLDLSALGGDLVSAGSLGGEAESTPSSAAGAAEAEEIICQQALLLSAGAAAGAAGETSQSAEPSQDPWGQDKCDLCPPEEDPAEEIQPETFQGPDGNQMYRVQLPKAGSFRCSETELGFEVRAAVTVLYRYDSWDWHLGASEKQQWMVAGPLFNIQVDSAGAVAAVHLPHFLCLAGGEADGSRLRIAHFVDEGVALVEPTGVRLFHATLQNPSFSPLGVLWRKIQSKCQAKVHSLALLYRALRAADTTLHLYLIPNDCSLRQAINDHESKCPSRRVHKPARTKPLKFGSCCVVSSSSLLEVIPEELEFWYLDPKLEQPYLEIYTQDMQQGLQLSLLEKVEGEPIWKASVRAEDVMPRVSSAHTQPGEHFIDQHRAALIQRVRAVDGVLDELYPRVLDNEQYQSVRAEHTDPQKMRKLYELVPSWNQACKDRLYQALEAKQKFLIQELQGM